MYKVITYNDAQYASQITEKGNLHLRIRGNTYADLFKAASIKEAWDYVHRQDPAAHSTLEIMCLIGQRADRRFEDNQSFDLKIVANFINAMQFDVVRILHPHSSVSLALIHNVEVIDHFEFVKQAYEALQHPVLISPDAGAYKVSHSISQRLNATLVPANKVRVNGEPSLIIQGDVAGKECLIIDDLADGGRTFSLLGQKLKGLGASKVSLYVTHGLFNYGFEELTTIIDHIYCTNSFTDHVHGAVTQFKVIDS